MPQEINEGGRVDDVNDPLAGVIPLEPGEERSVPTVLELGDRLDGNPPTIVVKADPGGETEIVPVRIPSLDHKIN